MMFGIVEFGMMLNGWVSITSNTREAARWASTGMHVSDVYAKVQSSSNAPGVSASDLHLEVRYEVLPTPVIVCLPVVLPSCSAVDPAVYPDPSVPPGTSIKVTV